MKDFQIQQNMKEGIIIPPNEMEYTSGFCKPKSNCIKIPKSSEETSHVSVHM